MKIKIEQSPYGDSGAEYEGLLGMVNHFVLQLESFRSPNKTPEQAELLEADLRGYREILKSNSHDNANKFFELKRDPKTFRDKFPNNEALVNHMKENGLWK